ncbi:resolvase [Pseudooceanicola nanhaiensis]|uniref:Resolvase n=1 Tax=Pseudooceanicola nanhaiensis TaxID=375761 RepID=A0A917SVV3_9RHOB|nr:recombinase family protein [Pseudooceanicola nanhaiensis]GGM00385.1 resolvase [Pseudooceanicola nanhaiensis]
MDSLRSTARRAVIYARFSTDLQNVNSTRDQIANCTALAERKEWQVLQVFEDAAISGAKRERPGYKKMLQAVKSGLVDVVLAEGLDRLNRSQELSANLFAVCEFNGVEIHTIAEGRIEELHIGMKGTMDAMHLKRIAQMTHRGLQGRVADGRSAGGLSYGYRIPIDPYTGLRQTGELEPDEHQADVVRRIFREFSEGHSPRAIAHQLNAEGVPSPRGREWKVNTIYGNAKRGTGILNNELYAGVRVWNRLQYRKNPETDQRASRGRDVEEIIRVEVPHLRIVDEELWQAVKARQDGQRRTLSKGAPSTLRRKRYLLSGLVRCGRCGGNMTVAGSGKSRAYYCANAKEKGPSVCRGMPGLRIDRLQPLVLSGLRDELMTPEAVERFRSQFLDRVAEARKERDTEQASLRRAIAQEQKAIDGALRAIRDDMATKSVYAMLGEAEEKKEALKAELAAVEAPALDIPENLAALYREQVDALADTLSDPEVVHRASEILGGLIDRIVIQHEETAGHTAEIEGKLLGLLSFADAKNAASYSDTASSLKLVAGVGFEPTTFRL